MPPGRGYGVRRRAANDMRNWAVLGWGKLDVGGGVPQRASLSLCNKKARPAMRFAHRDGCIAVPMVGFLRVPGGSCVEQHLR